MALDPAGLLQDAIGAIYNSIRYKSKFVLDADISNCFDRIDHKKLLEKVNTFPSLRRQIKVPDKAGVLDNCELLKTNEGTPQGGTLSPLLANVALHGLEEHLEEQVEKLSLKRKDGKKLSKRDNS